MSTKSALDKAIKIIGLTVMADHLNVSYQAIRGWQKRNRMPDTEYSCRSKHALKIEKLTEGKVTVADLLGHMPTCLAEQLKKKKSA